MVPLAPADTRQLVREEEKRTRVGNTPLPQIKIKSTCVKFDSIKLADKEALKSQVRILLLAVINMWAVQIIFSHISSYRIIVSRNKSRTPIFVEA